MNGAICPHMHVCWWNQGTDEKLNPALTDTANEELNDRCVIRLLILVNITE